MPSSSNKARLGSSILYQGRSASQGVRRKRHRGSQTELRRSSICHESAETELGMSYSRFHTSDQEGRESAPDQIGAFGALLRAASCLGRAPWGTLARPEGSSLVLALSCIFSTSLTSSYILIFPPHPSLHHTTHPPRPPFTSLRNAPLLPLPVISNFSLPTGTLPTFHKPTTFTRPLHHLHQLMLRRREDPLLRTILVRECRLSAPLPSSPSSSQPYRESHAHIILPSA